MSKKFSVLALVQQTYIQFDSSFILTFDPFQQMLLYSLVHAPEVFQTAGLIFQLLVESVYDFQLPVVLRSNQLPNNIKSSTLKTVNYVKSNKYFEKSLIYDWR